MAIFDIVKTTNFAIYKNQKSSKHQILLKNVSFGAFAIFSNNLWKIPFQIVKCFAIIEKEGSGNLVVQ